MARTPEEQRREEAFFKRHRPPAQPKPDPNPDSLRERLAALEHLQWAHWTRYMLDTIGKERLERMADENDPDIEELPCVKRWRNQIDTPYNMLSEAEKSSDREWADKALMLIAQEEPMMVVPDGWLERAEELLAEIGIELPPNLSIRQRHSDPDSPKPKVMFTVTAGTASSDTPVIVLTADSASSVASNMQWPDEEAEPDPEDRDE